MSNIIDVILQKIHEARYEGLISQFLHLGWNDYQEFLRQVPNYSPAMVMMGSTIKFHGLLVRVVRKPHYLSVRLGAEKVDIGPDPDTVSL